MLATNLKKTHKLKKLIIVLIVLIPALVLVSLYPQMEKAMLDKKEKFLINWEKNKEEYETEISRIEEEIPEEVTQPVFYLQDNFVNYVVETSYYQHALLLNKSLGRDVFTDVLDTYGWIDDYYDVTGSTPYYVEYIPENIGDAAEIETTADTMWGGVNPEEAAKLLNGEEISEPRKTQLISEGFLGYLIIEYDNYGKISNIRISVDDSVIYDNNIYSFAKESVLQYENNATYYAQEYEAPSDILEAALEVCPKNFRGVYLIYDYNEQFVMKEWNQQGYYDNPYEYEPYYAPHDLYLATGAYVIVAICALFVFLAAMILPFFKKLETGWEKLFSIPAEIAFLMAGAGIGLAFGMCVLMSVTTMTEISAYLENNIYGIELLGYQFNAEQCYGILIGINFLGWALAFFLEYICAAHLRQFFCGPGYYFKHRILVIMFIGWIIQNITSIQLQKKHKKKMIVMVLVNLFVIAACCCLKYVGIIAAVLYSVVIYFIFKKWANKLEAQYQNVLSEAVVEVSKSQNMKNELITNVSHDLKTPLTAIITYVDLLKNPDLTEEEKTSYVETLDLKSQRLKVLIEDLFEVSKANSGNVKMNFMDVDVVKLLKEVRLEMSDQMEESNLDFRFHLPEEKIILSLDGQRTYRIFENLLNNAIKYAMPSTRVYVDIINQESEVMITFKNMSAKELIYDADYLTERFVRGDSSRNSEGSGLGLAIAKSFTELQNGKFDIQVDGDLFKVVIHFMKS